MKAAGAGFFFLPSHVSEALKEKLLLIMIKGVAAQQCVQVYAQSAVTCELCRINNRQRHMHRIETLIMSLSLTCHQWKH